jgi:hypothetical protein
LFTYGIESKKFGANITKKEMTAILNLLRKGYFFQHHHLTRKQTISPLVVEEAG